MRYLHKAVPASYLLLRKDDNILLGLRKNSGYYDGWYSVPAGHVEEGELPIDCLIRETEEEIGIVLNKQYIRFTHAMYRTKNDDTGDRIDYFFVAEKWSGEPRVCEPNKCDDIRWFPVNNLPEKMMHHVRYAIECVEANIAYSELGPDRVVKNPSGQTDK